MPARLVKAPLGVTCTFSKGRTRSLTLTLAECYQGALAEDLLTGLVSLVHPHGRVDSATLVRDYVLSIRLMVDALADRTPGGARELTVAMLSEFWLSHSNRAERHTRAMLLGLKEGGAGLRSEVQRFAEGRKFNRASRSEPLAPYAEEEWAALQARCQEIVDAAYADHQAALHEVEATDGSALLEPTSAGVLRLLARNGPATTGEICKHFGIRNSVRQSALQVGPTSVRLFPSVETAFAYRTLFAARSGIVPDGIEDLGLGDIDWAGDKTVLLNYFKGRTSRESNNLPKSAVAILQQWLKHSEFLRNFASPEIRGALWIRCRRGAPGRIVSRPISNGEYLRLQGLRLPVRVSAPRVRTTFEALRDRSHWHGSERATIDPNHSSQTEAERYVGKPTPQQRDLLDSVIEDGQGDMLKRARTPLRVVTAQDAAEAARQLPQVVADLRLDETAIAELTGAERDVFAASCVDIFAGVFGPKGKPCPARPWVCLACPLAVFAPRHAVNLLRLKGFFTEQWRQMPSGEFMRYFGYYSARVDEVIRRFEDGVVDHARRCLETESSALPLRPEETPS
ncbi:hypothetical protein [Streptomyces sp. NBC_01768]|uniref:hypothetical protein n=1 Tax=Streptomyces sp. NBC_01768 TaxID=2975938 RepID=UPI002DD98533|nr:hypothetical protein [Streptomyces sp. NBC_01768]WSC31105.1 helix-turn-helix domain-containing protein [Streptomyces sp. NBC_01768]